MFVESILSEFVYLYLPIVVIMMTNATFFLLTARKIQHLQREIGAVTGSLESGRHQKRLSNEQEQYTTSYFKQIMQKFTLIFKHADSVYSDDCT